MTTLAQGSAGARATAPAPARRRAVESGGLVSIGDAARLIGVSPSALRLWERQGLVDPSRTAGGERRYGPADLGRLRAIVRFRRGEGLNAPAIRRLLAAKTADHAAEIEDGASGAEGAGAAPAGLGARLRRLRASRQLSIRGAAAATGLSASFISALERGVTGASLAALRRLVEAYGATLGELLRDTAAPAARHVRAGERRVLDAGGGIRIEDLSTTPSILESQLFVLAPGASSDGAYSHPGEEFMYVLAGSLGVWLDEKEWYQLATGDTLTFPSTLPHRFSNLGPAEARVIWINTPPTF